MGRMPNFCIPQYDKRAGEEEEGFHLGEAQTAGIQREVHASLPGDTMIQMEWEKPELQYSNSSE